jgi:hypothetical protein
MRPIRAQQLAIISTSFKYGLLRFARGFTSGLRRKHSPTPLVLPLRAVRSIGALLEPTLPNGQEKP